MASLLWWVGSPLALQLTTFLEGDARHTNARHSDGWPLVCRVIRHTSRCHFRHTIGCYVLVSAILVTRALASPPSPLFHSSPLLGSGQLVIKRPLKCDLRASLISSPTRPSTPLSSLISTIHADEVRFQNNREVLGEFS